MLWLGLTTQFKYSSLPQCEQGNTLKENKKDLSLQHNISLKNARKPSILWQILQNKTKKDLYFKYQCLFWPSFGTVQVEGSMNVFDHSFKIFSCGVFWETSWIPTFLFWASKNPEVVKDKRAEDQVHSCGVTSTSDDSVCHNGAIFIPTGCTLLVTQ